MESDKDHGSFGAASMKSDPPGTSTILGGDNSARSNDGQGPAPPTASRMTRPPLRQVAANNPSIEASTTEQGQGKAAAVHQNQGETAAVHQNHGGLDSTESAASPTAADEYDVMPANGQPWGAILFSHRPLMKAAVESANNLVSVVFQTKASAPVSSAPTSPTTGTTATLNSADRTQDYSTSGRNLMGGVPQANRHTIQNLDSPSPIEDDLKAPAAATAAGPDHSDRSSIAPICLDNGISVDDDKTACSIDFVSHTESSFATNTSRTSNTRKMLPAANVEEAEAPVHVQDHDEAAAALPPVVQPGHNNNDAIEDVEVAFDKDTNDAAYASASTKEGEVEPADGVQMKAQPAPSFATTTGRNSDELQMAATDKSKMATPFTLAQTSKEVTESLVVQTANAELSSAQSQKHAPDPLAAIQAHFALLRDKAADELEQSGPDSPLIAALGRSLRTGGSGGVTGQSGPGMAAAAKTSTAAVNKADTTAAALVKDLPVVETVHAEDEEPGEELDAFGGLNDSEDDFAFDDEKYHAAVQLVAPPQAFEQIVESQLNVDWDSHGVSQTADVDAIWSLIHVAVTESVEYGDFSYKPDKSAKFGHLKGLVRSDGKFLATTENYRQILDIYLGPFVYKHANHSDLDDTKNAIHAFMKELTNETTMTNFQPLLLKSGYWGAQNLAKEYMTNRRKERRTNRNQRAHELLKKQKKISKQLINPRLLQEATEEELEQVLLIQRQRAMAHGQPVSAPLHYNFANYSGAYIGATVNNYHIPSGAAAVPSKPAADEQLQQVAEIAASTALAKQQEQNGSQVKEAAEMAAAKVMAGVDNVIGGLQQGQADILHGQANLQRGQDDLQQGQGAMMRRQSDIQEDQDAAFQSLQQGQDAIMQRQADLRQDTMACYINDTRKITKKVIVKVLVDSFGGEADDYPEAYLARTKKSAFADLVGPQLINAGVSVADLKAIVLNKAITGDDSVAAHINNLI